MWIILVVAVVAIPAVLAIVTAVGAFAIDRSNPPLGRFVDVDGGRLHVVERGAPDAPPVVLMHGASGNLGDPSSRSASGWPRATGLF